ncbi:MAG: phosphoribosylamine--glycine ligase [bacterium]|nr:phosphoribosylamine--glycine ligase [bacterium]
MKILTIGKGAREHALAWRISQSLQCQELFVWPGNGGTSQLGWDVSLNAERLVEDIVGLGVDYVVIGPETFLAQGLVDDLQSRGIPVFGPTKAAAQLETSKWFALEVMREAHVPRPTSFVFSNPQAAVTFAAGHGKPVVVKADGLTGGKGVWLCHTPGEVEQYANLCWELHPNKPIVVQELLKGKEVSVFCFTDGYHISSLVAACDYKRLLEGDQGPNTGGMGSYTWPHFWKKPLEEYVLEWILKPVLRSMSQKGMPFSGMLYAGLMLTKDGPKVLEFNARFGDPEAQVILPLLEGDLLEIMLACTKGRLDTVPVSWNRKRQAVGVVMVSYGYPNEYESGHPITRRNSHDSKNALVFHSSTRREGETLVTDDESGRVLTVVGMGDKLFLAREAAYSEVGKWDFPTAAWREDIASGR